MPELEPGAGTLKYDDLARSEWSDEFEQYMRNRMIMGAMRYGLIGDPRKPHYDRIEFMRRKLDEYEKTGNLELLVDTANGAMLEYLEGDHPKRNFTALDGGEHAKPIFKKAR